MKNKQNKGFTLIELLMVLGIIAVLASFTLVFLGPARGKARDARRSEDMRQLEYALTLHYADHGRFPSITLDGISSGGEMIGDDDGPIEAALRPYMKGGIIPKDPRHDGVKFFYSYDPAHCIKAEKQTGCDCAQNSRQGATLAFNKSEADSIDFRKETYADSDMNQCEADYVAVFTPAAY